MGELTVVTGAAGFIGRELCRVLRERGGRGDEVRGIDIRSGRQHVVEDLSDPKRAKHTLEGATRIYHLAARMGGAAFSASNRIETAIENSRIDSSVIQGAPKGAHLVYASSACVYPTYLTIPLDKLFADGRTPLPGYGDAKLFGERLCDLADHIDTRIARIFTVYGPGGRADAGGKFVESICANWIHAVRDRHPLVIWGDGEQQRSVIHVRDCVNALIALMDCEDAPTINVASDDVLTPNRLVEMLKSISPDVAPIIEYDSDAPIGPIARVSDNTIARDTLTWRPSIPLRQGIEETFRSIAAR